MNISDTFNYALDGKRLHNKNRKSLNKNSIIEETLNQILNTENQYENSAVNNKKQILKIKNQYKSAVNNKLNKKSELIF